MIVRRLLSGGNMFTGCNTVNEYITRIFEIGLQQQYTKVIDNTEYEGYYLTIPSREKSNIKKLSQWQRLFVNIKTKSRKVYGETDTENTFGDCLMWAYEALYDILSGNNENFSTEQGINTLLIERDSEICSYVLRFVELKLKTFINSKRNPNYILHQAGGKKEFEKIEYYYLDDNKNMDRHSVLEVEEKENETGEVTEYILEKLLEEGRLTTKQRKYLETTLSDEYYMEAGNVYERGGDLVYNTNQSYFFKKQIAKAIHSLIQEDDNLELSHGRIIMRW